MINPPDDPARLLLPGRLADLGFRFGTRPECDFVVWTGARSPRLVGESGQRPEGRRGPAFKASSDACTDRYSGRVLFFWYFSWLAFLSLRFSGYPINLPGFSTDRVLVLSVVAKSPQPVEIWEQVAEHLRSVQGVDKIALADQALLSGNSWNNFISVMERLPTESSRTCALFRPVGWKR